MNRVISFMKFTLTLTFIWTTINFSQTVPDFNWVIQGSGSLRDVAYDLTVDPAGNIYLTGESFSSTLTFPGKTLTMASGTGNCDFFLVKFNPQGTAIWGIKGGGSLTDRGYGVTLDHQGEVLTTGHFFGTAGFGPYTLTSSGNLDCFTAKLDTAGNYLWMKEGKSVSQVSTRNIATDGSGNVIIVGYYGSATVDSVRFDSVKVITNGQRDCFIAKYNNDGVIQWAKTGGGIVSGEQANDVTADAAGNIYVTGIFADTATFSGTVLNGNGGSEAFIVKYNPNGQLAWARSIGGAKSDDGAGIALDGMGNLYVSGRFDSSAVFGTTNIIGNGGYDAFLVKYDTAGNFIWVKYGGGTGTDYLKGIECDPQGNIFGVGYFSAQATFGSDTLNSVGLQDILFIKYNAAGDVLWTKQSGGTDLDDGNGLGLDAGNNPIATGYFQVSGIFGTNTLVSAGVQDIYLTKIGNNPVPVELISFIAAQANGGIDLAWTTASETNNAGFEIERSIDNAMFVKIGFVHGFGTSTQKHEYFFSDNEANASKYYYRLKQLDLDGTFSYSQVVEIDAGLPSKFNLYQNYPNPFNPSTAINFDLPVDAQVNISVYNTIGEIVAVIANSNYAAGRHTVQFDGSNLASTVYLFKLHAVKSDGSSYVSSKKMMLMK